MSCWTLLSTFLLLIAAIGGVFCTTPERNDKVRLDFFVMSKCPGKSSVFQSSTHSKDTFVCETTFKPVIEKVGSIIDLHVNYIAKYDPTSETKFSCMHGQSECEGNLQQLCTYSHYDSNFNWWDFTLCQTETQRNIPNNGQECATELQLDYATIEECADGPEGIRLLNESIAFTQSKGIRTSCTMYVNDEPFCVHNGAWMNCKTHSEEGIIEYLCSKYEGNNPPPACSQ